MVVVEHVLPCDAPIFAEGREGVKTHPPVVKRPHDLLVKKILPSVFSSTEFEPWLKKNGVDTLAIIG